MKMKKALLLVLCAVLLVVGSVMGTLAYLQDTTDLIENTFTVGEVQIELTETWNTDINDDGVNDVWSAKLFPGKEYAKDPVVTVKANSEDCWLFVKVVEENNPATYLDYTYNLDDWTELEDGVYYISVTSDDADQSWHLLKGDKVTVKTNVVNADENVEGTNNVNMPVDDAAAPSISFVAYAIQAEGFTTAQKAWEDGLNN